MHCDIVVVVNVQQNNNSAPIQKSTACCGMSKSARRAINRSQATWSMNGPASYGGTEVRRSRGVLLETGGTLIASFG